MTDAIQLSADMLDLLIRELDEVDVACDIVHSQQEWALGVPLETRTLDLCWGYAPVEPATSSVAGNYLVVGEGVTRGSNGLLNSDQDSQVGLELIDLLADVSVAGGESVAVQDAYAFGSVFLVPAVGLNGQPIIETKLFCGEGGTGSPLLIARDVDQSKAVEWLSDGTIGAATPSSNSALEIMRFVLDIGYFDIDNPHKNRIVAVIVDLRKPRGWGGYSEEALATEVLPMVLNQYDQFTEARDDMQEGVYKLVHQWMMMSAWSPSFVDYWSDPSNALPDRLKQYLSDKFGIVIA